MAQPRIAAMLADFHNSTPMIEPAPIVPMTDATTTATMRVIMSLTCLRFNVTPKVLSAGC
jgi:hypothetical protein